MRTLLKLLVSGFIAVLGAIVLLSLHFSFPIVSFTLRFLGPEFGLAAEFCEIIMLNSINTLLFVSVLVLTGVSFFKVSEILPKKINDVFKQKKAGVSTWAILAIISFILFGTIFIFSGGTGKEQFSSSFLCRGLVYQEIFSSGRGFTITFLSYFLLVLGSFFLGRSYKEYKTGEIVEFLGKSNIDKTINFTKRFIITLLVLSGIIFLLFFIF